MPTIAWNEGSPADSDSAGLGDDQIRSLKTSVRVGLDGEHVWPSGGGDAGVHRFGSARPYFAAQSLVSSAGTDGRLMQTSDTSRLFAVGSGGTSFIGGATVLSAGSFPGGAPPQRYYWAMEFGEATTDINGAATVTYPNSGFSGKPFLTLGVEGGGVGVVANIQTAGKTSFGIITLLTDGSSSPSATVDWMSVGTRVL